jgi:LPS-assembly lipoprotein
MRVFLFACVSLSLATLSGCGFKPLYGVDSASHRPSTVQQFAAVEIPVLPDRLGQQLRNKLIDVLHPSGASGDPRYALSITIKEADLNLGLQSNATATRGQVRITAQFWLVEKSSGKILEHETLRTSTGYDILINQFDTALTVDDARDKGLQQLADDLTLRLALYFQNADQTQ